MNLEEGEESININELTEGDWLQIRRLTLKFVNSGAHGGDELKCTVRAFLEYISISGIIIEAGEVPDNQNLN